MPMPTAMVRALPASSMISIARSVPATRNVPSLNWMSAAAASNTWAAKALPRSITRSDGVVDRDALGGERARAAGAAAGLDPVGVALDDADLLERHVQPLVQHLGVGGVVALAVGLGADQHRRPCRPRRTRSRRARSDRPWSIRCSSTCRCRAAGPLACASALARHPGPVRLLQAGVHDLGELAGVVELAGRGLERHLLGRDEVLAPQLDRVDAQLVGRVVHQPLHAVDRFRPPGAAIGVDRHGVGEHALHAVAQHLHVVDARAAP